MKKATLSTIATILSAVEFEDKEAVMAELDTELNRGAEAKAARNAEYEAVRQLILDTLSDTPITISELYEAVKDELPANFGKGKVQYAVTKLFTNEIAKIDGKPNTYKRA